MGPRRPAQPRRHAQAAAFVTEGRVTRPNVKVFVAAQIPDFSLGAFRDMQTTLAARNWSHGFPQSFDYEIEKEVDGLLIREGGVGVGLELCDRPWSDADNASIVADVEALLEAARLLRPEQALSRNRIRRRGGGDGRMRRSHRASDGLAALSDAYSAMVRPNPSLRMAVPPVLRGDVICDGKPVQAVPMYFARKRSRSAPACRRARSPLRSATGPRRHRCRCPRSCRS